MLSTNCDLRLSSLVWKEFNYKLKAHSHFLIGLMFLQIFSLFTSGFTGSMGGFYGHIIIYSANLGIILSMIWVGIAAYKLTTKPYRQLEFTLSVNRMSASFSDGLLLFIVSVAAGVTSTLAGVLLRIIVYFRFDRSQFMPITLPFSDILLGMAVATLYMLLFAAMGYLLGQLIQMHKVVGFGLLGVIIGVVYKNPENLWHVVNFFNKESSILFFVFKVIAVSAILIVISVLLSARMEVKR